jgi:molecular chaperone HtpG
MSIELASMPEQKAEQAQRLAAFTGVNLLHIKRQVEQLLAQIGGNGIFDEYTKHDISHIDALLNLLATVIIPSDTVAVMSTAEWLMVVLAVYFHDLGMLVTKAEFKSRDHSDFPAFRSRVLLTADNPGKDYKARLSQLSDDERERFLYQEFVREHHAKRIRDWIEGAAPNAFGFAKETAVARDDLLRISRLSSVPTWRWFAKAIILTISRI